MPVPPGPGFGDSIGGHDHRRRDHGRAVPPRAHRRGHHRRRVAARRRACGRWARPIALSLLLDMPWRPPAGRRCPANPLVAQLRDRRTAACIAFTCLQAGKYWPHAVRGHRPARAGHRPALRRPRVAAGQQHGGHEHPERGLRRAHASPSGGSGSADFVGQWAVVQDTLEAAADPQTVANGYIQECQTAERHPVPAGGRAGAVRRGAGPARGGRPSSTSTATRSSPSSASTGTRSWTSRSAASSPDTDRT